MAARSGDEADVRVGEKAAGGRDAHQPSRSRGRRSTAGPGRGRVGSASTDGFAQSHVPELWRIAAAPASRSDPGRAVTRGERVAAADVTGGLAAGTGPDEIPSDLPCARPRGRLGGCGRGGAADHGGRANPRCRRPHPCLAGPAPGCRSLGSTARSPAPRDRPSHSLLGARSSRERRSRGACREAWRGDAHAGRAASAASLPRGDRPGLGQATRPEKDGKSRGMSAGPGAPRAPGGAGDRRVVWG